MSICRLGLLGWMSTSSSTARISLYDSTGPWLPQFVLRGSTYLHHFPDLTLRYYFPIQVDSTRPKPRRHEPHSLFSYSCSVRHFRPDLIEVGSDPRSPFLKFPVFVSSSAASLSAHSPVGCSRSESIGSGSHHEDDHGFCSGQLPLMDPSRHMSERDDGLSS